MPFAWFTRKLRPVWQDDLGARSLTERRLRCRRAGRADAGGMTLLTRTTTKLFPEVNIVSKWGTSQRRTTPVVNAPKQSTRAGRYGAVACFSRRAQSSCWSRNVWSAASGCASVRPFGLGGAGDRGARRRASRAFRGRGVRARGGPEGWLRNHADLVVCGTGVLPDAMLARGSGPRSASAGTSAATPSSGPRLPASMRQATCSNTTTLADVVIARAQ